MDLLSERKERGTKWRGSGEKREKIALPTWEKFMALPELSDMVFNPLVCRVLFSRKTGFPTQNYTQQWESCIYKVTLQAARFYFSHHLYL